MHHLKPTFGTQPRLTYIYMYVCICIYIYISLCICIYIYMIYICVCIYISVYHERPLKLLRYATRGPKYSSRPATATPGRRPPARRSGRWCRLLNAAAGTWVVNLVVKCRVQKIKICIPNHEAHETLTADPDSRISSLLESPGKRSLPKRIGLLGSY